MKTIFEDDNVLVQVDEANNKIVITNKMSDHNDNQLFVVPYTDGHLEIRAPYSRFHPIHEGFNLWLN